MGLDMYAFTMTTKPAQPVDFPQSEESEELHYWRKHPDLHGWMQRLYLAKGGEYPEFNLSTVMLENGDLDELEFAIAKGRLPSTSGFFFGATDGSEREDDLLFVRKAREAIGNGKTVFYTAWW